MGEVMRLHLAHSDSNRIRFLDPQIIIIKQK